MSCNGICNRYDGYNGNPKFRLGYKYCSECAYSIIFEGLVCPCCHQTLRRGPRHKTKVCC